MFTYISSLYWATSTLMLIGASGYTFTEITFTTTLLFVTVGIFAYLISNISSIIDDINKHSKEYKIDLKIMNEYMMVSKNNISNLSR